MGGGSCDVCKEVPSKYKCPSCRTPYCSVTCFKNHKGISVVVCKGGVIISAVTSQAIFQRMKNYTIYAVSITIDIVLGFMLLALIWKFDFPPFMVLIIAIVNDGVVIISHPWNCLLIFSVYFTLKALRKLPRMTFRSLPLK